MKQSERNTVSVGARICNQPSYPKAFLTLLMCHPRNCPLSNLESLINKT